MKLIFCLLISLSVFGQKDAAKKADSIWAYPDTITVKIPLTLLAQFTAVINMNGDGISVSGWREIEALIEKQLKTQFIKKPKK